MKQRLLFLFKNYCYWLTLFVFSKLLFILYQFSLSAKVSVLDLVQAIGVGFKMDIALGGYFMILISLLIFLFFRFSSKYYKRVFRFLNIVFTTFCFFIVVGDLELYKHWGFHVDTTPFFYLKTPKDAFASLSIIKYILLLSLILALIIAFDRLYKRYVLRDLDKFDKAKLWVFPLGLFVTACFIIPIRGGLGLAPINPGAMYFHKNIYVNHVALNPVWNFMYSLKKVDDLEKTYSVVSSEKMNSIVDSLYSSKGETMKVLNNKRPNVMLVLLESFSAKTIEVLGGAKGVTPNLNKLSKEGILFTHLYATGNRSDKGVPAVVSGYPANPGNSILRYPAKSEKLPSIAHELKKVGYSTAFYYGGDINFANFRQYFTTAGFDKLTVDEDFDSKYNYSKWGVHDHIMFSRIFNDIKKSDKPFFKMVFTLSSHEPFDVPMKTVIKGNSIGKKYLNSVYYTDKCIGDFIDKCKKSDIWDNTIFIFIADHGVLLPDNDLVSERKCFKIPMIWVGGPVTKKGMKFNKYCSQVDLASTLLNQMDIDSKDFIFSRNLFSSDVKSFVSYTYNDGIGFINDSTYSIYDNTASKYLIDKNKNDRKLGRVLLQYFYNDFLTR